jgi:hypothetical protein
MPIPSIGSFATRIYNYLFPVAGSDQFNNYHLAIYVGALGDAFQPVEDLAGDGLGGEMGWSVLVDIDRIPNAGIPYLGQYVGSIVDAKDTYPVQRQKVKDLESWKRGSPAAMTAAVQKVLTGAKRVRITERDTGSAWHQNVQTYTAETPDTAAVLAAIASQKPGGQIITHTLVPGQTYNDLNAHYLNYNAVKAAYANYTAVTNG